MRPQLLKPAHAVLVAVEFVLRERDVDPVAGTHHLGRDAHTRSRRDSDADRDFGVEVVLLGDLVVVTHQVCGDCAVACHDPRVVQPKLSRDG